MTKIRHCTFPHILKISCKNFVLFKSYERFVFFVFSNEIADCSLSRLATLLQKDCKNLLKFGWKSFEKFFIRKFGIVDKASDCDTQGHGFESRLRRNFKVSRLYKRRIRPISYRAHKSSNLYILTNFFFVKFHYLMLPNEWALFMVNRFFGESH